MKYLFYKRFSIVLLSLILTCTAFAYDFKTDGLCFNVISETESTVSLVGEQYGGYSGQITIPSTVTNSNKTYTVESIGANAFAGCTALSSVQIPTTVKKIENNAFWKCSNLQSVDIPDGVTLIMNNAFRYCTGLTQITIGKNVSSIEKYAFADCSALSYIRVFASTPPTMDVDVFVFANIYSTAKVCVNKGCKTVYSNANVWSNFTNIEEDSESDNLTSIAGGQTGTLTWNVYDNGVLKITGVGEMPTYHTKETPWYSYCDRITSISVSEGVTSIGQAAFQGLSEVIEASIPSTIKTIDGWGFYGCSKLSTITIPKSVTSIGKACFAECYELNNVVINSESLTLGWRCFWSCSKLNCMTCTSNSVPYVDPTYYCSCPNEPFGGYTPTSEGTLYVPKDLIASYKADSEWSKWNSIVSLDGEIDTTAVEVEGYNSYLESGISAESVLSTYGSLWTIKIYFYLSNKGSEDIYVNKLVIKNPDTNEVVTTYTDTSTSLLGTLTAGNSWNYNYTIRTNKYHGQWYEWYYTYKGEQFLFCSSKDDPLYTGIEEIQSNTEIKQEILRFNINGEVINTPHKGINIIKYSDGSTRKVLIK